MKKILSVLFFGLLSVSLFCSCAPKTEGYADVQQKLTAMKSYKTNADITYISNKSENKFSTVQRAESGGRYRIDTTAPSEYNGSVIVYDGKMIWQYNPLAKDNKINVSASDKSERVELLLFNFVKNMNTDSDKTASVVKSEDRGKYTVLEADLPGDSQFLSTEKLWVNNDTMLPEKLIIYNIDGDEKIVEIFDDFEYNYSMEDNIFSVDTK
jgi:outer membrane lipoprotein-sorting protein